MLGADVSSLQRAEELGATYFDEAGAQVDPIQILKDHGINSIRLRVWVDPISGCNSLEKVTQMAQRIQAAGLKLLIDLHYSDTWADPAHQTKPAAWADHSFGQLQLDVYRYTYGVCEQLRAGGVSPDMIQTGNEINEGFLWPDGKTANWNKLAALLKQAYQAVKAFSPSIQVMLHIANAGDHTAACAWFEAANARSVQWDMIGLSYYSYWHGGMLAMSTTVKDLHARYRVPVVIVETAYPFTLVEGDHEENVIHSAKQLTSGYPASPEGQGCNLRDVLNYARAGGAAGVFYWEPTWTAVRGNGWDPANPNSGDQWENQALFDYRHRALPALAEFQPASG